ncbi:MAG TPA: hypothetical protein VFK52_10230 [Nocardioidaceae bacterium]|nr:hypothetical protein [Nocardioidaceae bacterium]
MVSSLLALTDPSSPPERGATVPGEGQIPLAPVLDSNHVVALAFVIAIYAGFIGTLLWVLWKVARERDILPMILLVAGLIGANMEPLGDHVGLIVYAPDIPWFDYWLMGRQMPSFIAVGEASYLVFGCYYLARLLERGASLKRIGIVSAFWVGIPEILVEVGWHYAHLISYYGDNPTRILGVPLYSIVQNSTLLPILGVVTYLGARHLKGVQRWWLVVAIPCVTIGYIVGVSWPVYVALQSSAPHALVWLATAFTIAASVGSAYAALQYPEIRARRQTLDAPELTTEAAR